MIAFDMNGELDADKTIQRKMTEMDTLVNLVKNGEDTLSDELKIMYLERIDEIMKEIDILKIHRSFKTSEDLSDVTF